MLIPLMLQFLQTWLCVCNSLLLTFKLVHELDCSALKVIGCGFFVVLFFFFFLGQKIPLCWFKFWCGSVASGIL